MTTGIWSSSYNPPDFAQKSFGLNITRLRPTGMTTLLALTSLFQGETAKQIEHGFWTEALIFPELELSANAAAGDALLNVVSTENILPNMVFQTTGTIATSRAAPHPASHRPTNSSALTTVPPSISRDASATAKSWGTARGEASASPRAAPVRYDRGVETASRNSK